MDNNLWNSWGASVIGPLHSRSGLPNQDAWISRHYNWGDVVVVSDGLGSCPNSDIGSRAACLSALDAAKAYCSNKDTSLEDMLRLMHAHWLVRIAPFEPRDCSATCLIAVRKGDMFALAQLGDGLIAACGHNEEETLLMCDNKEDSFSNITFGLGREFKPEQWMINTVSTELFRAIVLCTDGISDDLIHERLASFAFELYRSYRNRNYRKRKKELRAWLNDWPVRGHSDDKTIACLYKKGSHKNE